MSVVCALHLERYVMFATDSRTANYDEALTTLRGVRDGDPKLMAIPQGLMAGSGYVPLLESVMQRMPEARSTRDALAIIRAEQRKVQAEPWFQTPHHRILVDHTGWVFTAHRADGNLRLTYYHLTWGDMFHSVEPGDGLCWFPDAPGEETIRERAREDLCDWLKAGLRVCQPGEALLPSLAYHQRLLQEMLAEAARRLPTSISPDRHYLGIHTASGLARVFPLAPAAAGAAARLAA